MASKLGAGCAGFVAPIFSSAYVGVNAKKPSQSRTMSVEIALCRQTVTQMRYAWAYLNYR